MTDDYPPPNPRPRLEITFDDLDEAVPAPQPQPQPRPQEPKAAVAPWPPAPAKPLPDLAPAPPAGWQPPPPGYPPSHYPPPAYNYNANNIAFAAMAINHKSTGVAVLLSLLLTGAGQVYCGRVGRGIAFFFAGLFSAMMIFVLVGLILLPIVWIWAAIDAGNLAKRQNEMLMAALASQS